MNDALFSQRLHELYQILSEKEKRELARYLSSAYFNRDKCLYTFHAYLCKAQPDTEKQDKKAVWKFVFGKVAYNEKKFRYMVSDLLAAIEEFIYIESVLTKKPNYVHTLDEYYTLREAAANRAALGSKVMAEKTDVNGVISSEFFLEQHFKSELIEELHAGSLKGYSKYISANRTSKPNGLDIYYVVEKLRQICLTANDNNVFGTKQKVFYESEILHLASSKQFVANEFIQAYLMVYRLLTDKSEEQFFALKKVIDTHGYDFEEKNLSELFTYARNFCISKINAGKQEFYSEVFDLYEIGLKKRALLLNGEINERNYKNIVTTALRIKKHTWTFDFINEYRYKLNKAVRDNAYNYNLANYYFSVREYDKALRSLQKVQLTDLFYGLDARSLTVKCYYEMDEKEAFLNSYFSFRIFVMRKKNVSEQHRKNYLNFLRLAKKLMNIRVHDKKSIQKIGAEIENSKAIADKGWLKEKLNLLTTS